MSFATPVVEDLYWLFPRSLAEDFSVVFANIHPDDLPTLCAGIDESLRQLIPWYGKYRYRHPSKGTRWIEGWSRPQVEPDGSVLWHGFVMDVTDQSLRRGGAPRIRAVGVLGPRFRLAARSPCWKESARSLM